MDVATAVPFRLWRGELRVQGLLLRKPLVTAAQAVVGLAILIIVVLRVRDLLTSGAPVQYLNITIVSLSLGVLMAANVTLLGERTGTLPWQLQRWASRLPIGSTQLARLIVVFSLMRSGLITLTLLGAVAVGALTSAHSVGSALLIVLAALVLPLLPIAVGLQWARRRGTSPSFAFTLVPLGVGASAMGVPLPMPSGWLGTVLQLTSLPAMTLAGRASLVEALVLLAIWAGAATALLRPAALSLKAPAVGAAVWRPRSMVLDLAVHQVTAGDLFEVLFLGVVACSVVALEVFSKGTTFGAIALAVGLSSAAATATLAGYVQMKADIRADDATEAWIRALPVSVPALSIARHATCVAGALLATLPVIVLAVIRSGDITLALWAGLSAWALSGWFASYLSMSGWRKHAGGYALFTWFAVRAVVGAAAITTAANPIPIVGLFAVDLAVGLAGQWRGATAAARSWK